MNRYTRSQFVNSNIGKPVMISGLVSINASAAVTAQTMGSLVTSVARTAAGTYTITLADTYNAAMSINCTLQAAVAVDLVPQISSVNVTSTKLIVVKLLTGAVATDPAAAVVLHVNMILNASSISG